jgi:hypothetical protein
MSTGAPRSRGRAKIRPGGVIFSGDLLKFGVTIGRSRAYSEVIAARSDARLPGFREERCAANGSAGWSKGEKKAGR